jgi:hypothetical protein
LKEGEKWVSGDYSAATDNLDGSLTEVIWNTFCETVRLSDEFGKPSDRLCETFYQVLGLKALVGHCLHYPDGSVAYQQNGQLMGSPLSFPILCIANAAATLVGLGKDIDYLFDGPIAINGDDIGFPADDGQYQNWKRVVTACGLEPSIGKNYFSAEFLIINSELRLYNPGSGWTYKGSLNLPLLWGQVEKGPDAGSNVSGSLAPGELGPRCHDLIAGMGSMRDKLIHDFVTNHKKSLSYAQSYVGTKVSFYLPQDLGGLGLPKPTAVKLEEWDLKWAATVSCLTPEKQIELIGLPAKRITGDGPWRDILSKVDKELDAFVPKKIFQIGEPGSRPYGQNPLTLENEEICSEMKLGLTLSIVEKDGWHEAFPPWFSWRDICEQITLSEEDHCGTMSVPKGRECLTRVGARKRPLIDMKGWAKKVHTLSRIVSKSTLTPMCESNALSYKKRYCLQRSVRIDSTPAGRQREY